jgi:hypothetical protein
MIVAILAILVAVTDAAEAFRALGCSATSKGYVVGAKLPPSGLFELTPHGGWKQLGFNHPHIVAAAYDPRDPRIIYLAAGNGCIRSIDGGQTWRITTGWDMTELQDVVVDVHHPDTVFVALPDGIGRSDDNGRTWRRCDAGISRKFTKCIRVDRATSGRLLAGTEQGVFLSEDGGASWRAHALWRMITSLEQSPHDSRHWLAATQRGGLFSSSDQGISWQAVAAVPGNATLHQISYDPHTAQRIAISGWGPGVLVSEDGGRSFTARNAGLPSTNIWTVRFDPGHPGRLYASVHEEALFVSDDAGKNWTRSGLEGSIVFDLLFVPEVQP